MISIASYKHATKVSFACLLAYITAHFLSLDRVYWVVLTAAVVTGLNTGAAIEQTIYRIAGSAIGLVASFWLFSLEVPSTLLYFLYFTVIIFFCLYKGTGKHRPYVFLLIAISFMMMLENQLSHNQDPTFYAVSRLIDLGIGAAIGLLIGGFIWPNTAKTSLHNAMTTYLQHCRTLLSSTKDKEKFNLFLELMAISQFIRHAAKEGSINCKGNAANELLIYLRGVAHYAIAIKAGRKKLATNDPLQQELTILATALSDYIITLESAIADGASAYPNTSVLNNVTKSIDQISAACNDTEKTNYLSIKSLCYNFRRLIIVLSHLTDHYQSLNSPGMQKQQQLKSRFVEKLLANQPLKKKINPLSLRYASLGTLSGLLMLSLQFIFHLPPMACLPCFILLFITLCVKPILSNYKYLLLGFSCGWTLANISLFFTPFLPLLYSKLLALAICTFIVNAFACKNEAATRVRNTTFIISFSVILFYHYPVSLTHKDILIDSFLMLITVISSGLLSLYLIGHLLGFRFDTVIQLHTRNFIKNSRPYAKLLLVDYLKAIPHAQERAAVANNTLHNIDNDLEQLLQDPMHHFHWLPYRISLYQPLLAAQRHLHQNLRTIEHAFYAEEGHTHSLAFIRRIAQLRKSIDAFIVQIIKLKPAAEIQAIKQELTASLKDKVSSELELIATERHSSYDQEHFSALCLAIFELIEDYQKIYALEVKLFNYR